MRKIIAGINMTLDGFCDHTAMTADDELHDHYTQLLIDGGAMVYGRTTYQLMESYWPTLIKNPSGNKAEDDFAVAMQNIPKLVFSHTLKSVEWENATLASRGVKEELLELRQQPGNDILIGSPSLIVEAMNLDLVDEFQIAVHPVIVGKGLPLLKNITDSINLTFLKSKTFKSGAILIFYAPTKK